MNVGPHKQSFPDGETAYYDGRSLMPIVIVKANGEMYPGWNHGLADLEQPEVVRIIGQADKRTYNPRRAHR